MKKFLIFLSALLLVVASVIGIILIRNEPVHDFVPLTFEVKSSTTSFVQASFILSNTSDHIILFDESFILEKLEHEAWIELAAIEQHFLPTSYLLLAGEVQLITQNWKDLYGELAPGLYRITKFFVLADYKEISLYAEFEVLEGNFLDSPFFSSMDFSYQKIHILEYWNATIAGDTLSGWVPEHAHPNVDSFVGWVQRTGIIAENDVGNNTVIFSGFTDEMEKINVAIYVGERQIGYWLEISSGDCFDFVLYPNDIGEAFRIVMNSHIAPFGGRTVISIMRE